MASSSLGVESATEAVAGSVAAFLVAPETRVDATSSVALRTSTSDEASLALTVHNLAEQVQHTEAMLDERCAATLDKLPKYIGLLQLIAKNLVTLTQNARKLRELAAQVATDSAVQLPPAIAALARK